MLKAIVFDLGGVLIKENNYPLSKDAQVLEKEFGNINYDNDYFEWAERTTGYSRDKIEAIIEDIITNIYELRDPEIFDHLPNIKLAIASNHLSCIKKWIDKIGIRQKFYRILISADIGFEKPNKNFFEKLILEMSEKPEDILFIDDNKENIEGARKVGLKTLHYNGIDNLLNEVLKNIY